jgi:anti-anti-sigma factor
MDEKIKSHLEGTTLTIILGAELAKLNAPAMQQLLSSYLGQDIRKIVFDATDLVFISSAGIRCIIFARQELGHKPEIVFVNCAKEIYEVFEITGLFRFISFVEDNRVKERKDRAEAGDKLQKKIDEVRQDELDHFAANNDVVVYQMKLGEEE